MRFVYFHIVLFGRRRVVHSFFFTCPAYIIPLSYTRSSRRTAEKKTEAYNKSLYFTMWQTMREVGVSAVVLVWPNVRKLCVWQLRNKQQLEEKTLQWKWQNNTIEKTIVESRERWWWWWMFHVHNLTDRTAGSCVRLNDGGWLTLYCLCWWCVSVTVWAACANK